MDTNKLKELAKAATQGPWEWDGRTVDEDGYVHIPECSYLAGLICLAGSYEGYQDDCDYIAAANPQTMLSLIDRIDELERQLAELSAQQPVSAAVDEREEFEKWARSPEGNCDEGDLRKYPEESLEVKIDGLTYINPYVDREWLLWQARAALQSQKGGSK